MNCVVVFRLAQPVNNFWEALYPSTAKPRQVSILMGSFWIQYISHYSLRERCSSMWKPRVIGVSSLRGKIILTFHNHFECTLYLPQLITVHGESFFFRGDSVSQSMHMIKNPTMLYNFSCHQYSWNIAHIALNSYQSFKQYTIWKINGG